MAGHFQADLENIRKRAREHMDRGAVTNGYGADLPTVLKLLNEALATELVCTLRYRNHHFAAKGINAGPVADEFLEHSNEEQQHADWIAARITQLGGNPDFNPRTLTSRASAEYVECNSLFEMIQEDLVAERIAIDIYGKMICYMGNDDPTTRRLLEQILAVEEEHAEDLATLLKSKGAHDDKSQQLEFTKPAAGALLDRQTKNTL